MSTQLSFVNPYLPDPVARKSMVIRSAVTSSAIEGIRAVFERAPKSSDKSSVRKGRLNQKKG
jgi:hypothetical protein